MVAPQSKRNEKTYRDESRATVLGLYTLDLQYQGKRWLFSIPFLQCRKSFCRVLFQLNDFFHRVLRNYQRHFFFLHPFHRIAFAVHRLNNKWQVKDHFRIWPQAEGIRPCKLRVHTIP